MFRNFPLPVQTRFLFFLLLSVLLAGCSVKQAQVKDTANPAASTDIYQVLPFGHSSMHAMVADVDGNQLPDLGLTTHGHNKSQIFFQTAPRVFEPGPEILHVGFHPNDLMPVPIDDRKLFMSVSEGVARLQFFELGEDREFKVISRIPQAFPRAATFFRWPGWGLSLAVVPKNGSTISLLRNVDPVEGTFERRFDHKTKAVPRRMLAVDIDGDGIDELLTMSHASGKMWIIRYPGSPDAEPVPEELMTFDRQTGGKPWYLHSADLDGDGDQDIVTGGHVKPVLHVLRNDGTGQFSQEMLPFSGSGIQNLATRVEKDGYRYLFATGHMNIALYRFPKVWTGGEPEMKTIRLRDTQGLHHVVMEDIDRDGWLDVVFTRGRPDASNHILYGPLWENFSAMDKIWPMEMR